MKDSRSAARRSTPAPSAQTRALATYYLGQALLDAGRYHEAVTVTLDGVADFQLAGLDIGFGGYLDALAAEALIRLGQWADAEVVLARRDAVEAFNAAHLRLCRTRALGAGRRGHIDAARSFLAEAVTRPVDSFHQLYLDAASAEVHLIAGDWQQAALAAERGWEASLDVARLWSARFAMFSICAAVEQTLDNRARRQAIDERAVSSRLAERLDRIGSPAGSCRRFAESGCGRAPRSCHRNADQADRPRSRRMGGGRRRLAGARRPMGDCHRPPPRSGCRRFHRNGRSGHRGAARREPDRRRARRSVAAR